MEQAPRKLYIDSRARVAGTHNNFTWSPVRPLYVPKSRAYFESVSIPNVFNAVNGTNNRVYVTEEMGLRVTGLAQNMYWSDNGVQRISNLTPQTYADNAALATELQFRMGANYAVLPISGGSLGRIEIIATGGFRIYSRAELKQMTSFGVTLRVVCLSYAWLQPEHPDAHGTTLARFTHDPFSVIVASPIDHAVRYLSLHDNRYLRAFRAHTAAVVALEMSPKEDIFI